MVGEFKTVRKGHEMTNRKMFFTMLWGAVFRRRSRAVMAVIASMVGAATLFCLAATCIAVPQQMNEEMRAYGANLIVTPSESLSIYSLLFRYRFCFCRCMRKEELAEAADVLYISISIDIGTKK